MTHYHLLGSKESMKQIEQRGQKEGAGYSESVDKFWKEWYESECPKRLRLIKSLQLERACVLWQISESNTHGLNSMMNSYFDDLANYLRRRWKKEG